MNDQEKVAQMAKIVAMHSEINWCQAAGSVIASYFSGDDITFKDFEVAYAIKEIPGRQTLRQMLGVLINESQVYPGVFQGHVDDIAKAPEVKAAAEQVMNQVEAEDVKTQLIETILAFMVQSSGAHDEMRSKMRFWTTSQLEAKLQEVTEKTKLQELSTDQIRDIVIANDQVRRDSMGRKYPVIPLDIQPPQIKRMKPHIYRDFIKTFGSDAVNARLNGSDTAQQEYYRKNWRLGSDFVWKYSSEVF